MFAEYCHEDEKKEKLTSIDNAQEICPDKVDSHSQWGDVDRHDENSNSLSPPSFEDQDPLLGSSVRDKKSLEIHRRSGSIVLVAEMNPVHRRASNMGSQSASRFNEEANSDTMKLFNVVDDNCHDDSGAESSLSVSVTPFT